ncbi:hypothetical protein Acor_08750 [Acrocarpospora corrugata]|uniref:Glycosyl hydrolase family 32 N-terminal domain-containing protein n=1 Tax=Acrocarpospora corrugata TaxID=35763 RepID=A0A5M3VT57_9ACTN|nr:hypothetical protein Acor_08750 [Acrocarpospora corrugata]
MFLPQPAQSTLAVPPPGDGPGFWAGAPSAVAADGFVYLAYRLRRPLGEGRGYAVAVARSADGERFETLLTITKEQMHTESLERPTLVRTPSGRWRLYLSCATYGTKHWRVELLEADDPAGFDPGQTRVVLPGDLKTGVKDPVIVHHGGGWHLWASCHPLEIPAEADQMVTDYATSSDGVAWTWQGTALDRRPGHWDSRGVRVSAVRFTPEGVTAYYDGRASAQENYEERTGVATGPDPSTLTAVGTGPHAASPYGGLRYLDLVPLPGGGTRLYYEWTRPDGAHELRTELRTEFRP